MDQKVILTDLWPFELSHFKQLFALFGIWVCVINFSYCFQWMFLKFCRHIVDILKMCMWIFDGARNNFDGIITLYTWSFWAAFHTIGYGVCVVNSSF